MKYFKNVKVAPEYVRLV